MPSKYLSIIRPCALTTLAAGLMLLAGCDNKEPTYYEVQNAPQPPAVQPMADMDHSGHDHPHGDNNLGFTYTLPAGWSEKPASSMVLLALQAGSPPELVADVSISAFPGDVGGKLANINRWRRQIGLGPIDESAGDISSPVIVSGLEGWQVEFTGAAGMATDGGPLGMIVTAVAREGQTWFFKMTGPHSAVRAQKENYLAFLTTVKF